MPYKIEIIATHKFPDGKSLNQTIEKWFEDPHELTARRQAFDYLWTITPEDSSEYNVVLYYSPEEFYTWQIYFGLLFPLSDYNDEEWENRIFRFDFDFENLHKEYSNYIYEKYDTGGEPIILYEYLIYDDEGNEIEPVILAMNKNYLKFL